MTGVTETGGTPNHCPTCRCLGDTDSLTIYAPNETMYGRCPVCKDVMWHTEIHAGHRGSSRRSKHCGCCTHPHDLNPGGYTIPRRGELEQAQHGSEEA